MSQRKEDDNNSNSAEQNFVLRTGSEDDDGQDVRDVLSRHRACVYMPPLPQHQDNRGASGAGFSSSKGNSQFNVFHQLGARPFSQQAAAMDQTINLDDNTQLNDPIDIDDDEDEVIILHQDTQGTSSTACRYSDDIVIIDETGPNMSRRAPVRANYSGTAPTEIAVEEYGGGENPMNQNAAQRDSSNQQRSPAKSTGSDYGDVSMELETSLDLNSSSSSNFAVKSAASMTSPRAKNTLPQSSVGSAFKGKPYSAPSPPQKQSKFSSPNSRQLHTTTPSQSTVGDDDVTFLLEKKKTPFASQSSSTSTKSGRAKPAREQKEKDENVRDAISFAFQAQGGVRSWQSCRPPKSPPLPTKNTIPLTVCTYNVLCQNTIGETAYLYGHLSSRRHVLEWSHRSALLRKELPMLDADIFCLQEVQAEHFDDFYAPLMSSLGYEGYYKKRTGEKSDGCAIFWRKSKFEMTEYRWVEYNVMPNSALDRDNVGMIVSLMVKGTKAKLLVANTHLLFNQSRGDVKLAQLAMLFAHLEQMSYTGSPNSRESIIICGDFNMEPLSPIYEFVVTGDLEYVGLPQSELSGQGRTGGRLMAPAFIPSAANVTANCLLPIEHKRRFHPTPLQLPTTGSLQHQFNLMSVYRHKTAHNSFELSTYHSREAAMPDFIFYSLAKKSISREESKLVCRGVVEDRLKCVRRLELPDQRFMDETVGRLPNEYCPSDHLPLLAEFVFDTS